MERVEESRGDRSRPSRRSARNWTAGSTRWRRPRADEGGKIEAQRDGARGATARRSPARIPADLVELYEKQRARYGIGAAAAASRGVSMGSNVKLTESDLAVIRRAAPDDVVLCPDSGAILVRERRVRPLIAHRRSALR